MVTKKHCTVVEYLIRKISQIFINYGRWVIPMDYGFSIRLNQNLIQF